MVTLIYSIVCLVRSNLGSWHNIINIYTSDSENVKNCGQPAHNEFSNKSR